MQKPKKRNTRVSAERLAQWAERFAAYRDPPNQNKISDWLGQFDEADKDVAARILDAIEVVSHLNVAQGYRDVLNHLDGWHHDPARRAGRWFFLGFGRPGASGHTMLSVFREANGLEFDMYDDLFPNLADVLKLGLTSEDTIVFVDDIAGSGKQVCELWPQIEETIGGEARVYLLLSVATQDAIDLIKSSTRLEVQAKLFLDESDNIFHKKCRYFNDAEKEAILSYCKKIDNKFPRGFNDCGLLIVIYYKTPNNTIPIIHKDHKKWMSVFPRRVVLN